MALITSRLTAVAVIGSRAQSGAPVRQASSAVSSMQEGVRQVGNGVELANQAGDSINRIRDGALRVTVVVNGISDSISEQSVAGNEIAQKLEVIAQMSEQSAIAVRQTADAARQMQALSNSLRQTVAQFKT